ncbi:Protein-S-isoprenylcysteine O-methyltransferase [Orchesella cincta]|uniref:Protein-S-isoprenylcysteine O-methyltransferase n=1 Tax=Orchesella cincta TaxID=48709 RepID=A0A1D2NLM7_ORCCI|nr:Protein-S-isoprenylcysteine O-methyltransferase [Orchesella cincta]
MHEFGFTSLNGFMWGCALALFHRMIKIFPYQAADVVLYGVIGAVLSRYCLSDVRASLPANKPMTSAQVRVRGFFLGWAFSVGLLLFEHGTFYSFGIYCCILSFFHYSEFFITSLINPETLALSSFLLNHSKEYGIAAVASVIEFFVESYFFPGLKQINSIVVLGTLVCLFGELVRKGAMLTAWNNFTHLVRDRKVEGHRLITHGLYSLCRHPGYAGWFWWSVGTQIILINPICLIGYALASARFFQSRIYFEEACLISFFSDYPEYQKKVPRTGVPFAEGFLEFRND